MVLHAFFKIINFNKNRHRQETLIEKDELNEQLSDRVSLASNILLCKRCVCKKTPKSIQISIEKIDVD